MRTSVETLARLIAALSAKAAPLARSSAERVSAGLSAISAKVRTASPQLHGAFRKGTETAGLDAKEAAARSGALLARIKPSPSAHENEVSSPIDAISSPTPARIGGFDRSQMLIISGVVLLVCGGLLVGSGLLLRAGTGPMVEKAPSAHSVAWFFEEPALPIVERSVFTAELTPQGVRLTGLAIKAENNSDEALSGLEGVVKPDAKRVDLKLEVKVDMVPADGAQGAEAAGVQANGVIPPHAFFSLVFPFPPEAQGEEPGIALNDFIAAYGGLMLKLRYDVAGTQKSLIHYLSPEMLKSQLTEIQHEADGSSAGDGSALRSSWPRPASPQPLMLETGPETGCSSACRSRPTSAVGSVSAAAVARAAAGLKVVVADAHALAARRRTPKAEGASRLRRRDRIAERLALRPLGTLCSLQARLRERTGLEQQQ